MLDRAQVIHAVALLLQRVPGSSGPRRDGGGFTSRGRLPRASGPPYWPPRAVAPIVLPGDLLIAMDRAAAHHLRFLKQEPSLSSDEAEGFITRMVRASSRKSGPPGRPKCLIGKNLGNLFKVPWVYFSRRCRVSTAPYDYKDSRGIFCQGFVRRNDPRAHFPCFTAGSSPRIPTAPTALRRRHRGPSIPARPTGRKTPRRRELRRAGPWRPARSAPAVP